MHIGHKISGAGHLALLAWMAFGDMFAADPLPMPVTDVSVISGAEFDALLARQTPSEPVEAVMRPEPRPEETEPEPEPEAVQPAPLPDVSDQAPILDQPGGNIVVSVPEISDEAVPQAEERVAPEPVARPEPDALPDTDVQEAVREDTQGDTPEPPAEATAPEAAATEIVTEAERPARVLETSRRPPARRPVPPAQPVPAEPEAVAEQTPEPETPPSTEDAVAAALEEALGASQDAPPVVADGPPLSAGEKEALRVAVSDCWNVVSLSTDALATTVVVGVSMARDGKPVPESIVLVSSSGGPEAAARQAFEAARRAILRCGARGFDLPVEKYGQWQQIEMTFNPERMRIR